MQAISLSSHLLFLAHAVFIWQFAKLLQFQREEDAQLYAVVPSVLKMRVVTTLSIL